MRSIIPAPPGGAVGSRPSVMLAHLGTWTPMTPRHAAQRRARVLVPTRPMALPRPRPDRRRVNGAVTGTRRDPGPDAPPA